MKKLSKIMAMLLAVCLVFALCACGGEKDTASDGKDADTKDNGKETLTMATNAEFPPYEYHENNKIVGIDAEVAQAIADKLGMELVIEDMDFSAIIAAVQGGKADIGMAGMTVTDERLESVDFSASYATGVQVIIVKEGSEITSPDDLSKGGYTIGVQESTTGDIYLTDDLESKDLATIERYNKGADAIQALLADKIDCVVIDNEPAKAFVEANEGLKILDTSYVTEDYAICFAKDNTELGGKVNDALEELIADGTVKGIIDKYINAD